MNTQNNLFRAFLLGAIVLLPGLVQAQVPDANIIIVEQGTHKLFRETGAVTRVAVGNAGIADVNIINRRELLITGKTLGVTSLIVWPAAKGAPVKQYRIKVAGVKDPLRASAPDKELAQALIDPGKSLEGSLPNLLAHRRAKLAALNGGNDAVADRSWVNLETQVMTEVKIAEVNRNTLQQFGFNFFKNSGSTTAGISNPGTLSGINTSTPGAYTIGSGLVPLRDAFNLVVGDASKGLLGVLSLLERKGMARVLAEPTLLATSGQTANYLAGGEFPVPVSQGGASGGGITIQYKEFGVRLKLSPTVLARDRISLKVAPEVSDLDFSAGIQVAGVAVPALTVRRTDTMVELGDGESFVISGLVSSNLLNNVSKVPWLGDIPVLGAFFRSASVSKQEKELIMVVTPHLVRPMARGTRLPKLPGAKYDQYDPNFAETMLLETGDFDTGFSR